MSKYKGRKPYFPEAQRRLTERGQRVTFTATMKEARIVKREVESAENEILAKQGIKNIIALIELGVFGGRKAQGATT